MKKVFCDICGTAYPTTSECCPICGSPREYALEDPSESTQPESPSQRKSREIFDYDEVNAPKPAPRGVEFEDFDDEDTAYEEESGTNVGLVIVLVVLIALLLLATGFFFVRYMLPNMSEKSPETTVPVTESVATESSETTEPTIPCTNLMMDGGKMELGKDGKKLLNVRVYPENTTDTLTYVSENEGIATVSDSGTVTAVGEGQTVITVTCGNQQIKCNVTVDYTVGEEAATTGTVPPMTVVEGDGQTEATEATQAPSEETKATEATQAAQTTEATEATKETAAPDAVLKMKKSDITLNVGLSCTLELENNVDAADAKWFTMDSTVAIVHEGKVTALGRGVTKIYAEYKGQKTYCIVRCN